MACLLYAQKMSQGKQITQNVEYLPIDTKESVQLWANAIIDCKNIVEKVNRTSPKTCTKYDITEISRKIEGYYKNLMEKQ